MYTAVRAPETGERPAMPLPSYLQRRNGGRYHFQMRLTKALASCLGRSHLRFALGTTDSREARRRMMTTLDWAFEFREAPDLERAGEALTRRIESFVLAGPPTAARDLTDRQTFEGVVGAFIAQARDRDFAFVRLPGFVDLFKIFTEQNIKTENLAASFLGREANPVLAPVPAPQIPSITAADVEGLFIRLDARLDRLDAGLACVQTAAPASEAFTPIEDIRLSIAVDRFMAAELKRRGDQIAEAALRPILNFLVGFLDDRLLSEVSYDDLSRVDAALPQIPHTAGCSMALRIDLHARYLTAQTAPWEEMRRVSETTLKLRYQR
jgi:hypothetical protein